MRIPITKEGLPFLLIPLLLTVLLLIFPQTRFGWIFWLCAVITGCIAGFFRDPERQIPQDDNIIVSPADGKIILIQEVKYPALGADTYRQVSIFMSVFNVHVNRAPIAGTVDDVLYNPGKFFAAFEHKASLLNEQNSVIFSQTQQGKTVRILVKQIAGLIARRIVCDARPGSHFERGERIGMIRFGSRVDLFFPLETELIVNMNDNVKGGQTIIARFL
ncbi:MAG: phosphatidylserine decarboxylase family protein [Candidatus Vecturithrix sp.]|jgi:phosphatidylserine decarboxylase|nr:phosphatidylserine decarboxylase family protein [Candidatus Vecturithrix sp.]